MDSINIGQGAIIGGLVGLITACVGAYKDSPHEGFDKNIFWRSPLIAAMYGGIGARVFPENKSRFLLAGFASTAERITVEAWKATTGKMPSKFTWGSNLDRGWLYG